MELPKIELHIFKQPAGLPRCRLLRVPQGTILYKMRHFKFLLSFFQKAWKVSKPEIKILLKIIVKYENYVLSQG